MFGGPAWELEPGTNQYYLHNFLVEQPDLDWWNEDVRHEFEDILRFWFDRGVAGFRIDVSQGLIKDRALRDDPPSTDEDPADVRRLGQRPVHKMNRPEVHEIYRRWRAIADGYDPPRLLVGETWVPGPSGWHRSTGRRMTSSTCASTSHSSSRTSGLTPCARAGGSLPEHQGGRRRRDDGPMQAQPHGGAAFSGGGRDPFGSLRRAASP